MWKQNKGKSLSWRRQYSQRCRARARTSARIEAFIQVAGGGRGSLAKPVELLGEGSYDAWIAPGEQPLTGAQRHVVRTLQVYL